MGFAGRAVIDAIILASALTFSVVGAVHIVLLWRLRTNFFIVLR